MSSRPLTSPNGDFCGDESNDEVSFPDTMLFQKSSNLGVVSIIFHQSAESIFGLLQRVSFDHLAFQSQLLLVGSRDVEPEELGKTSPCFLRNDILDEIFPFCRREGNREQIWDDVLSKEKNNGGGSGLVNMAKAFQAAIIALDDIDSALYSWALFVLQGWWMDEPPLVTEQGHPWSHDRPSSD